MSFAEVISSATMQSCLQVNYETVTLSHRAYDRSVSQKEQ